MKIFVGPMFLLLAPKTPFTGVTKPLLPFLAVLLIYGSGYAQLSVPDIYSINIPSLKFEKYCSAYEDVSRNTTAAYMIRHSHLFRPVDSLQYKDPLSYYWLTTTISNYDSISRSLVLSFEALTFVDLYLFMDTTLVLQKRAGAFRKKREITSGDKRNHFSFLLSPKSTCTVLLKVEHIKHYTPRLHFTLWQKDAFLEADGKKDSQLFWLQGAMFIFAIYTLVSWIVTRYRPYLWLLLFITGIRYYNVSINNYLADWLFPNHPQTAWMLIMHYVHASILGIYLLMMDFWNLKARSMVLHLLGKLFIVCLLLVSVITFLINYFTSNFNLTNNINLVSYIFPFTFISYCSWVCWPKLTSPQRFLAYGMILFLVGGLATTLLSLFFKEASFGVAPYVTSFTVIGVCILFSIGLKEEHRQHEKDKQAALYKLNELQWQQNLLLENMVKTRTADLLASNQELDRQQHLLAERNQKIETLMNELSHRVKNNLQLLYSLIKLQLPAVGERAGQDILKGNISRIKAMMLVNEKLSQYERMPEINLNEFTRELALHSTGIYTAGSKVSMDIDIPSDLLLDGRQAISFGIILSELLTNSFKYAFNHQPAPAITIQINRLNGSAFHCLYADNGRGMEETVFSHTRSSMGLSLIKDLTRQLKGSVAIRNDNGLKYYFTIPV